jgi:phosphatidate phosphatase PAH1
LVSLVTIDRDLHVQFLWWQVDIEINGVPVEMQMKLGESGEAFFVEELPGEENEVGSIDQNEELSQHLNKERAQYKTKWLWLYLQLFLISI